MTSNFVNQFLRLSHSDYLPISNARRFQSIDWKYFASINIEQLENSLDFDVLQKVLPCVIFCNVVTEFENMDTNFQKFNQLCQIIIRFLLQSQNQLLENFSLLNTNLDQLVDQLKRQICRMAAQRKEIHYLRKQIFLRQSHRNSFDPGKSFTNEVKFPCKLCNKIFQSLDFLRSHNDRRHPQVLFDYTPACDYHVNSSFHGIHKTSLPTKSECDVDDIDKIHQLNASSFSENAIVELIIDKVNEHVSFMKQNLEHHVTESQGHFINSLKSTVQEEILRNAKENACFKESLVCEMTKQDNTKAELENLFMKYQNLVDHMKSQLDGRSNLGELQDGEKTEFDGVADDDTSNISSFDHVSRSKGIIEKQLSHDLEVVQHKLRIEHNELLKIGSTEVLSLFSESDTANGSATHIVSEKNEISSPNDSNSFVIGERLQIQECDTRLQNASQLPLFNGGEISTTSRFKSKEHNPSQVSSMGERISHSTTISVFIQLQHLIDQSGSLFSRTNHLQQFLSAICLTKLGILCSSDLHVYQENLLLKNCNFIDLTTFNVIKNHMRLYILRKVFDINTVSNSTTISDDTFDSLISDFRSSQVDYATKNPDYLHIFGISVYNLLMFLTNFEHIPQKILEPLWCSYHYNRDLSIHETKNASIVNNRLFVCSSLTSEVSHENDSLSSKEVLPNNSRIYLEDSAQKLNCQHSFESEFSNKDEGFNTSLSKLSCVSTLGLPSNSCLGHDTLVNLPFNKQFPIFEDCISSDFSLSEITDFTDIQLEADFNDD